MRRTAKVTSKARSLCQWILGVNLKSDLAMKCCLSRRGRVYVERVQEASRHARSLER